MGDEVVGQGGRRGQREAVGQGETKEGEQWGGKPPVVRIPVRYLAP